MSKRRRMQKRTVTPAQPHKYIVHAECAWYDSEYGALRYTHPTVHVVATDPVAAIKEAEAQVKNHETRYQTLCKFNVERITDRGATAAKEDTATCTIGLL